MKKEKCGIVILEGRKVNFLMKCSEIFDMSSAWAGLYSKEEDKIYGEDLNSPSQLQSNQPTSNT